MITLPYLLNQLKYNREVIYHLLAGSSPELITFKPSANAWCLLEIICHLIDEEKEDFRSRLIHVIENPETSPTPITPQLWVKDRKYMEQNFEEKLEIWYSEREQSLAILEKINLDDLVNGYQHKTFGRMNGWFFLHNWVAHDYLHIRQITRNKYQYLSNKGLEPLEYAGRW